MWISETKLKEMVDAQVKLTVSGLVNESVKIITENTKESITSFRKDYGNKLEIFSEKILENLQESTSAALAFYKEKNEKLEIRQQEFVAQMANITSSLRELSSRLEKSESDKAKSSAALYQSVKVLAESSVQKSLLLDERGTRLVKILEEQKDAQLGTMDLLRKLVVQLQAALIVDDPVVPEDKPVTKKKTKK